MQVKELDYSISIREASNKLALCSRHIFKGEERSTGCEDSHASTPVLIVHLTGKWKWLRDVVHTMGYYSALKKNKNLLLSPTWMTWESGVD